jgi:hypothetical protein
MCPANPDRKDPKEVAASHSDHHRRPSRVVTVTRDPLQG